MDQDQEATSERILVEAQRLTNRQVISGEIFDQKDAEWVVAHIKKVVGATVADLEAHAEKENLSLVGLEGLLVYDVTAYAYARPDGITDQAWAQGMEMAEADARALHFDRPKPLDQVYDGTVESMMHIWANTGIKPTLDSDASLLLDEIKVGVGQVVRWTGAQIRVFDPEPESEEQPEDVKDAGILIRVNFSETLYGGDEDLKAEVVRQMKRTLSKVMGSNVVDLILRDDDTWLVEHLVGDTKEQTVFDAGDTVLYDPQTGTLNLE